MTKTTKIKGPKITKEDYERSQRTSKKVRGGAKEIRRAIARVRAHRGLQALSRDPLSIPVGVRLSRHQHIHAAREMKKISDEIRATLLRAARVARAEGFAVRSSKDRAGRVSSYYCTTANGPTIRISDHDIPATVQRDAMAAAKGCSFFSGYAGPEIIIDRHRSTTWLRRAITLAHAGR